MMDKHYFITGTDFGMEGPDKKVTRLSDLRQ